MQQQMNYNLSVFLFGAIFNIVASINMESLVDYTLKAAIGGGGIWLGFQILLDYLKKKRDSNNKGNGKD